MGAEIIEIAKAVTDQLNAATLSREFTARRAYVPPYDLEALSELHVTVIPTTIASGALTRTSDRWSYDVYVGIHQRIDTSVSEEEQLAENDALMQIVEEIAATLRTGRRLPGYEAARCMEVKNTTAHAPDLMDSQNVFASLLVATYEVWR